MKFFSILLIHISILIFSVSSWKMKFSLSDVLKGNCQSVCPRVCYKVNNPEPDIQCRFYCKSVCGSPYRKGRNIVKRSTEEIYLHVTPLPNKLRYFDVDGNDMISRKEFARVTGHNPEDEDVKIAFQAVDLDNNGQVDSNEFKNSVWIFEEDLRREYNIMDDKSHGKNKNSDSSDSSDSDDSSKDSDSSDSDSNSKDSDSNSKDSDSNSKDSDSDSKESKDSDSDSKDSDSDSKDSDSDSKDSDSDSKDSDSDSKEGDSKDSDSKDSDSKDSDSKGNDKKNNSKDDDDDDDDSNSKEKDDKDSDDNKKNSKGSNKEISDDNDKDDKNEKGTDDSDDRNIVKKLKSAIIGNNQVSVQSKDQKLKDLLLNGNLLENKPIQPKQAARKQNINAIRLPHPLDKFASKISLIPRLTTRAMADIKRRRPSGNNIATPPSSKNPLQIWSNLNRDNDDENSQRRKDLQRMDQQGTGRERIQRRRTSSGNRIRRINFRMWPLLG